MNTATPARDFEVIDSICDELAAVCDRMYAPLDFDKMFDLADEHGMEDPWSDGYTTVLRMSPALEVFYLRFHQHTDWTALGEVLNRASIPFTAAALLPTDRYLNKKTGRFSLDAAGRDHGVEFAGGTFSLGTIAATGISMIVGVADPDHPTVMIVDVAREYMVDRLTAYAANS